MDPKREVTFAMRKIINLMRRLGDPGQMRDERITPMQGRVIGYLKHHPAEMAYQRDLEREFQIRRSTASAILQTMERDGLIRREPVPQDARLKKLVLTARAEAFSEHFRSEMARAEALITRGVSPEDLDTFFRVMEQFEQNLQGFLVEGDRFSPDAAGRKEYE